MFFVDTDILSAFAKADAIKYLKEFCKELNISPSIYEELMRAQRAGYSFADEILQNVEIVLPSEDEFQSFRKLLESRKELHEGECQLIVLCKSRKGILLTNDRFVKKFCIKSNINFLDLEDLLRALKLRKVLKHDELKKLIENIEKKDFTIIKSKEAILGD